MNMPEKDFQDIANHKTPMICKIAFSELYFVKS